MAVTSRQGLADYCLEKLGAPLLNIEIDDIQVEHCITEALEYYHEYHPDGMERDIYKHQITASDVTNQFITLPDSIISIVNLMPVTGVFTQDYLFDGQYQFWLSEIKFLQNYNTSSFYTTMNYLNHVNFILNKEKQFRYNRRINKLFIDTDWSKNLKENSWLVLEVYRTLDPELHPSAYDDRWLKKYTTALVKEQWGQNLSKFDKMELPGGVIVNGWEIKQEAQQEKDKLEKELYDIGSPLSFLVG